MSVLLRSLSDRDILSRIQELVVKEREITLLVLLHLNEIERRRLHVKHAYRSMFDFCTSGLGYSASAASRRIRTARCIARFPEVYPLLDSNDVNLSTIAQVSKILTVENRAEVFRRIRGKSQKEVQAVVAEYEPMAALPPDRVRPVVLLQKRVPVAPTKVSAGDAAKKYDRCGCNSDTLSAPAEAPKIERCVMIQFSASEEFMAKVERVRAIAWHRLPGNAPLERVIGLALDLFIEREDPSRRNDRRKHRGKSENRAAMPSAQGERHIPARVRDEIFARDKGQCTFVGPTGRCCASTVALQIDHINPVAHGGVSTPDNLRLLCAYHNRVEAERLMGPWEKPRANARP